MQEHEEEQTREEEEAQEHEQPPRELKHAQERTTSEDAEGAAVIYVVTADRLARLPQHIEDALIHAIGKPLSEIREITVEEWQWLPMYLRRALSEVADEQAKPIDDAVAIESVADEIAEDPLPESVYDGTEEADVVAPSATAGDPAAEHMAHVASEAPSPKPAATRRGNVYPRWGDIEVGEAKTIAVVGKDNTRDLEKKVRDALASWRSKNNARSRRFEVTTTDGGVTVKRKQ